jgi:hypothetical protein
MPPGRAVFAVLLAIVGFFVAGVAGLLVGAAAGAAGPRRARALFLASALALLVTAGLTIFEGPLNVDAIYGFPHDRPAANLFGAIAAVLLLAGLAGTLATHGKLASFRQLGASPEPAASGIPRSTIAAVAVSALLGTLMLWVLGDQRWEGLAPWLLIVVFVASFGFLLVSRLRSGWAGDRSGA